MKTIRCWLLFLTFYMLCAVAYGAAGQTPDSSSLTDESILATLIATLIAAARIVEHLVVKYVIKRGGAPETTEIRLSGADLEKLESILTTVRETYDIKTRVLERINELKTVMSQHTGNCDNCTKRVERILADTDKLLDMHDRTDEFGVPVWYVPRAWVENQREVLAALARLAEAQRETLLLLERLSAATK